jgi:hypothetical protein
VTARGQKGVVKKLDLVKEQVTVYLEEAGELVMLPPDEITWEQSADLPTPRKRSPRRSGRRRH